MRSHRQQPGLLTALALTVAVLAVSSSAPLIAFAAAPALAVAFWRNGVAAVALTPVTLGPRRTELRFAARRDVGFCVLAGLALAAHFGTWMPSVQLGSVTTATALVATQPVWQGLIAAGQGRRPAPVVWAGIGFAVAGAAWATGVDLGVSRRAVLADVLALLGGVAAAVYTALGERARTRLSTTTYTWICYGVCAVVLLGVCLAARLPLAGYDRTTWLAILGIVCGAQLLGHSMFNYALHRTSATTVSVLILLETPGATLLAWAWLGQTPRIESLPGLALLLAGVAVVVIGGGTRRPGGPASAAGGPGVSASLADGADPSGAAPAARAVRGGAVPPAAAAGPGAAQAGGSRGSGSAGAGGSGDSGSGAEGGPRDAGSGDAGAGCHSGVAEHGGPRDLASGDGGAPRAAGSAGAAAARDSGSRDGGLPRDRGSAGSAAGRDPGSRDAGAARDPGGGTAGDDAAPDRSRR